MASTSSSSSRVQFDDFNNFDDSTTETAESEQMFEITEIKTEAEEYEFSGDPLSDSATTSADFQEEEIDIKPDISQIKYEQEDEYNDLNSQFVITEIHDPDDFVKVKKEEENSLEKISKTKKVKVKLSQLEMRYSCEHCGKKFIYLDSYHQHRLMHALESNLIECNVCKKLLKKSAMDYHMKYKHSESRNFQCTLCLSRFKSPGALRHHTATFHPTQGYDCMSCDRVFKTKDLLEKHIEFAHMAKKIKLDSYNCQYCGKIFDNQGQLTLHIGILGKKLGKCRDSI